MPTSLTQDYTGRQVDLTSLDVKMPGLPSGRNESQLRYPEPATVISGIQKSIQAFVSLLFTVRGSGANQTLGCDFLSAILQGRVRSEQDLRNHYLLNVVEVLGQVNSSVVLEDERLARADLQATQVDPGRIGMTINFTSAAGSQIRLLVPVAYEK